MTRRPRHLLTAGSDELRRFAEGSVLVAFDYDGTLSPIVADPEAAGMRPATRRLLAQVARRYPSAVISGRAQSDLRARLGSIPLRALIGNHGLEPSPRASRFAAQVRRWLPVLEQNLGALEGVVIEQKGPSISIHHRHAKRGAAAVRAIAQAIGLLGPVRVIHGKKVVSLLPQTGLNKGVALERLRKDLGLARAIYVGDDTTDEDVFALAGPQLLTVRIGKSARSAAEYHLRHQREIDAMLIRLVELRKIASSKRKPG